MSHTPRTNLTTCRAENADLRAALQTQAEEAAKLMQQRDELLAALEKVVTISDRKHDAWDEARAAITNATNQT